MPGRPTSSPWFTSKRVASASGYDDYRNPRCQWEPQGVAGLSHEAHYIGLSGSVSIGTGLRWLGGSRVGGNDGFAPNLKCDSPGSLRITLREPEDERCAAGTELAFFCFPRHFGPFWAVSYLGPGLGGGETGRMLGRNRRKSYLLSTRKWPTFPFSGPFWAILSPHLRPLPPGADVPLPRGEGYSTSSE